MKIADIFRNYIEDKEKFEQFHNDVINMPRDTFSKVKILQIRSIAAYLLVIKDLLNNEEGNNYKQILQFMIQRKRERVFPKEEFRNKKFESDYLLTDTTIDDAYQKMGRMFRHYMELCEFFGIISSKSRGKKIILEHKCKELLLANESDLFALFRIYLINNNIYTNTYIRYMFDVPNTATYNPTIAIIQYIKEMNRPCTTFEIATLLGRVDNLYDNESVLKRALIVGEQLPPKLDDQIDFLFREMKWVDSNNNIFSYRNSQEPHFKFNVYIVCMEQLGLLKRDNYSLMLTDYSENLLETAIPIQLLDLNIFAQTIASRTESISGNNDALLKSLFKNNNKFANEIRTNPNFIIELNHYSLNNPFYNRRTHKRIRNYMVNEAAKILAGYKDESTGAIVFLDKDGYPYCEAHHVLEFSRENGPDITDNLVVLDANNHACIHKGNETHVQTLYGLLKSRGVLNIQRFEHMIVEYNCLTKVHIRILLEKKIINNSEYQRLNDLYDQYNRLPD